MKIKIILGIVMVAMWSNSDAQEQGPLRRIRGIRWQPAEELLEPQIPISEAMDLAKDGNGKGFYQLAIRYAQGNELPKDNAAAYKMLCKACDVNYANAILVEGICDEGNLRDGASGCSSPSTYKYCGASFSRGWKDEWLTNEVAFARVMKKYEKARDLGALVATNQIDALNKRLANFYKKEAEAQAKVRAAEENDRRLAAILGENIRQQANDDNDKCQRERERTEQRQQLLAIQEELRREREAAASAARAQEAAKAQEEKELKDMLEKCPAAKIPEYQAALKAIVGYEMGENVGDVIKDGPTIKLRNSYRYFDTCELRTVDGCLYEVYMQLNAAGKYTQKSLEAEADGIRRDLARRFNMEFNMKYQGFYKAKKNGWRIAMYCCAHGEDHVSVIITNEELKKVLDVRRKERLEAQKVALPVFGEVK